MMMTSTIFVGSKIKAVVFNDCEIEKLKKEDSIIKTNSYNTIDDLKDNLNQFKKGKLYAVKNGKINGIFFDWNTCSQMVNNISGALYKGFATLDEAIEYMDLNEPAKNAKDNYYKIPYAYVDGSFNAKTKTYGYGVIIMDEETSYEFSDSGNDKDMCSMQNVAGEILGAQRAITEAIALGLKEINVYYDYQGIESWADGSWKRNKKGTVQYYEFVQEAKKLIGINFYKVKAHSGITLNEKVDKLAKSAVGL
jgi:ribonuclease HI